MTVADIKLETLTIDDKAPVLDVVAPKREDDDDGAVSDEEKQAILEDENITQVCGTSNISPFFGATDTLFWTFGDICSGFQSQGGSPHLHALSPASNGFFRFTSGLAPAQLLAASMTAIPFSIHILAYIQVLVGLVFEIKCATASQGVTRRSAE